MTTELNQDTQFKQGLNNYVYYKYLYQIHYNYNLTYYLRLKKEFLINLKGILNKSNKKLTFKYDQFKKDNSLILATFKAQFDKDLYKIHYDIIPYANPIYDHKGRLIKIQELRVKNTEKNKVMTITRNHIKKAISQNLDIIERYKNHKDFNYILIDLKKQIKEIHHLLNHLPKINICNSYDFDQFKKGIFTDNLKILYKSFMYYIHRKNKYSFDIFTITEKSQYEKTLKKHNKKTIKQYAFLNSLTAICRTHNFLNIYNPIKD